MENFLKDFKISDFKEHVQKKAMWAGKTTPINMTDLYGINTEDKIIKITNLHTPALFKSIDEIIVNATDHYKSTKKVDKISVNLYDDGYISVYNNGLGIPIVKDSKTNEYYIQLAFSRFLTGTNIEKSKDCIKGGTNGLGAKITNIHSSHFIVETVFNKQKYIQEFKNRLNVIQDPIITNTNEKDYTIIKFLLSYKELGYKDFESIKTDLISWFKLRIHQVAIYTGKEVKVSFNNEIINCITLSEFANKYLINDKSEEILNTLCKNSKYELNISVIISSKVKKGNTLQNMAIINGVISNKGNHITYIRNKIKEYIEVKLKKISKKSTIDSKSVINLRLLVVGCIPDIDWTGQNKDTLQVSNEILNTYKISDIFFESISKFLISNLKNVQPSKEIIKIEHDKYFKAQYSPELRKQCLLFAVEGDSAITLLRTGLTQRCNKIHSKTTFVPSFNWIGIISLQGVIINAAKEVIEHETNDGILNIRSNKLRQNKRLNMLVDAFGLRYDYTYESNQELATLNYDKLIICTDQDLDGVGKICSLVLVWIYTFWPNLIKNKKIGKLQTPIIRVYKKDEKIDFYYENDFTIWYNNQKNITGCKIKYYKGLATHDSLEAEDMFCLKNFNKNVYLYSLDDIAHELFNIYFGPDPNLRKKQLINPVVYLNDEELESLKKYQVIPVGRVQLDIDTKLYKLEAINRQIPHIIDGLNPTRRKILTASIIKFSQSNKEIKIFQLGGYISYTMSYCHGDTSINNTIINMAQSFYGARKFPYLLGIGQFGSRHDDEAGSARYISVKLNPIVNLLFPNEDKWLLDYTFVEGLRVEPDFYVPILPMAALESYHIVSEGWNHKSIYRSIYDVVKIVKDYINNKNNLINLVEQFIKIKIIPKDIFDKYKLSTNINFVEIFNNIEYSLGNYEYNPKTNIIYITELPYSVSTKNYIKNISKLTQYILKIEDYSSTDEIDIKIHLLPDVIKIIEAKYGNENFDAIQDCFKLYLSLKPNLNYSYNKSVVELDSDYLSIVLYWLPIRKEFYKKRILRKQIILEIIIIREESIIKYIQLSNKLNLSKIDNDEIASNILLKNNLPKINNTLLNSPSYTPNDKLKHLLLESEDANYDYILDIKERELTISAVDKRQNKLLKLKEEYDLIIKQLKEKPFIGCTTWLEEINDFCQYIKLKI